MIDDARSTKAKGVGRTSNGFKEWEIWSMTYFASQAGKEDSSVLQAAIGLAEQIRAASDEIETGRRIPQSIAAAMKEAGVFGMAMPYAWGGPELDPLTQIRVIEALAMADGSVGWCAMIGCDSGYITAFLDQVCRPRD